MVRLVVITTRERQLDVMPRKRGGRRGRRGGGEDGSDSDEEDPLKSIAGLVTSPSFAARTVMVRRIVDEIGLFWAKEPPTQDAIASEQMIYLYFKAKHPCFELARLAAISVKNTLCAVLISKLEDAHQLAEELAACLAKEGKQTDVEEGLAIEGKQTDAEEAFTDDMMDGIDSADCASRLAIVAFIHKRAIAPPTADSASLEICEQLTKNRKLVRRWVQYCRDDETHEMAVWGQRLLKLLCRVPRSRRLIAGFGGAEALVTAFLAILKRMRSSHRVSAEFQEDYDARCEEFENRLAEVSMCAESNALAKIQSMRGLRQAKRDYVVTQAKLEEAKVRLDASKLKCSASLERLAAKQQIQHAFEAHMVVILSTLGLIVSGPDPEMQAVMFRHRVVNCVVDLIRMGSAPDAPPGHAIIRALAIETIGFFADRFPPTQDALREEQLLPLLLNELNRPAPKGDSSYSVLVSNVMYQCIDGNAKSSEAVCGLGIISGLCRMLHALYDEIINPPESDGEEAAEAGVKAATESNHDDELSEAEDEVDKDALRVARLRRSEASLRILAACSTSSEARKEEILREHVVLPLLTLAAQPDIPEIVLVSLTCLANLAEGHEATQHTLLAGDANGVGTGFVVLCSILQRVHAEVGKMVREREARRAAQIAEARAAYSSSFKKDAGAVEDEPPQLMCESIAAEASRCLRVLISGNTKGQRLAMDGAPLLVCCHHLEHRASDAMRRDAAKVLSACLKRADIEVAQRDTDESKFNSVGPRCSPPFYACQQKLLELGVLPFLQACIILPMSDAMEKGEGKGGEEGDSHSDSDSDAGADVGDLPSDADQDEDEDDEDEDAFEATEIDGENKREPPMDIVSEMYAAAANAIGHLIRDHEMLKDFATRLQNLPESLLCLIDFADPVLVRARTTTDNTVDKEEVVALAFQRQLGARWVFPFGTFAMVRVEAAYALASCIEHQLLGKEQAIRADAMQKLIMMNGSLDVRERIAASVALQSLCHNSAQSREDFRALGGFLPLIAMLMGTQEEVPPAVRLIACTIINNSANKTEVGRMGGVPVLVRLLSHANTERTLQFALVLLSRHIIMHPEDACVLIDAYGGKALPKLVHLIENAESDLSRKCACQVVSLCAREGGARVQTKLLQLGTMKKLVSMVTPPLTLDEKTALFCLSAMAACATDEQCRKRLKKVGVRRVLEAIGSWSASPGAGSSRDFEFLRRAASNTLAVCTAPFFFDDGSAELEQALIVSDIITGTWKVNMH
jgi:hypothetical protein